MPVSNWLAAPGRIAALPLGLRLHGQSGSERAHIIPGFGGRDQRSIAVLAKIGVKKPGTPKIALRRISAPLLDAIGHLLDANAIDGQRGVLSIQEQAAAEGDRCRPKPRNDLAPRSTCRMDSSSALTGCFVGPEMNGWPQHQPHAVVAGKQPIVDERRVLPVRQNQPLSQYVTVRFHNAKPAGRPPAGIRSGSPSRRSFSGPPARSSPLSCTKRPSGNSSAFRQFVQHHDAPERRGKRGDQIAVIAARDHA